MRKEVMEAGESCLMGDKVEVGQMNRICSINGRENFGLKT
jgi:hypothetical protein